MLPARNTDRMSLADVFPSCLASLDGSDNRLGLRPVSRAVVVLVDGLGASALKARSGHARTLGSAKDAEVIESGFPTTTAAAIASLTTGATPGEHGLVGYSVLDPEHERVVNQLTGWDEDLDPATWQRLPTVFETAVDRGFRALAIGSERYRNSGFTDAVLRGAEYAVGATIEDRFTAALNWMQRPGPPALLYVYVPELDISGHASGCESQTWIDWLETLDAAMRNFISALRPSDGVVVTADHGMLDVPQESHIHFDRDPRLVDGVRFVAGDPRCLQLHFDTEASPAHRAELVQRWRDSESHRSWVLTRREAIEAGWFGQVDAAVEPRIGDLMVAARKRVAYYDSRTAATHGRAMIGQHGSWSPEELRVPLLRFGAFER